MKKNSNAVTYSQAEFNIIKRFNKILLFAQIFLLTPHQNGNRNYKSKVDCNNAQIELKSKACIYNYYILKKPTKNNT